MGPKKTQKTPTKVNKPDEDPNLAANRLKAMVEASDAQAEADRAAEVLRVEEQKRQLSQDAPKLSDPSKAGGATFSDILTNAAAASSMTPEDLAALQTSCLANGSSTGAIPKVSDKVTVDGAAAFLFAHTDNRFRKEKVKTKPTTRGAPPDRMSAPIVRADYSKKGGKNAPPSGVAPSKSQSAPPPTFPAVAGVTQTTTSVKDLMLSMEAIQVSLQKVQEEQSKAVMTLPLPTSWLN
jgi:hypothetical protein